MITFKCPCGKIYKVDDKLAGRTAKCQQCGQRITIPALEPVGTPIVNPQPVPPVITDDVEHENKAGNDNKFSFSSKIRNTPSIWISLNIFAAIAVIAVLVIVILILLTPKIDENTSIATLRHLAEQGNIDAQYQLGFRFYIGTNEVSQDYEEAVKWLRMAAERGNSNAQYQLGKCCEFGFGLTKDNQETVKWYRKAAEQGHPEAQYALGFCYEDGHGIPKDEQEAVKWYQKAAKQGNTEAQNALSIIENSNKVVATAEPNQTVPQLSNPSNVKDTKNTSGAEIEKKSEINAQATVPSINLEDVIVNHILGETSHQYLDYGFADVTFGVNGNTSPEKLGFIKKGVPCVYCDDKTPQGEYIFDVNKNLVCFTKLYVFDRPPLDEIRKKFGQTTQEIRTSKTKLFDNSVSVVNLVRYTFPKVCIFVSIEDKQSIDQYGQLINNGVTIISVIDRNWLVHQIRNAVQDRHDIVKWIASTASSAKRIDSISDNASDWMTGSIEILDYPFNNISPTYMDDNEKNILVYSQSQDRSTDALKMDYFARMISENIYGRSMNITGRRTGLNFSMIDCPSFKRKELYNQGDFRIPLSVTPFARINMEVNLLLCQKIFPSIDGKITYHSSDAMFDEPYFSWVTNDELIVKVFELSDIIVVYWEKNKDDPFVF